MFIQTHRMYNTENELHINHGFCVIMICPRRLIKCNECTTLVGDEDHGGGDYACVRQEGYGKSPHLHLNFVVNLKLL